MIIQTINLKLQKVIDWNGHINMVYLGQLSAILLNHYL